MRSSAACCVWGIDDRGRGSIRRALKKDYRAVISGSYCATRRGVIDGLARVEQLDREDQWLELTSG